MQKFCHNVLDQGTLCGIYVRHLINQILHKLEAVILLIIMYPISIITSNDVLCQFYLNELPSDKVAQVIDVCVERITRGCIPMFRCWLITAAKRGIERLSRVVLPRQAKINQVITGRPLCPGVSLGPAFEVSTSIHLRGVESLGVHFRRIEHDIVGSAVSEKALTSKSTSYPQVSTRTCVQCFARA